MSPPLSRTGMPSETIAVQYFFEELSPLIGADASHRWLSGQVQSKTSSSESSICTSPAPSTRATDGSMHGRDIPNAKRGGLGLDSIKRTDDQPKIRKMVSDIVKDKQKRSPKPGPSTPSKSQMASMTVSLGLASSGQLLRRTNSVERKLGLLFTDAAHTILD
jgi:hypothetical protein